MVKGFVMDRIARCFEAGKDEFYGEIVKAAAEAALKAGSVLKALYGKPHQIDHKGEIDLVTEADWAAEKTIIPILTTDIPEIGVLAEESSSTKHLIPEGPVWIIDPLDGTTNFAHGFPWFAVSIGYAEEGEPRAGVIYAPMQDELFCAAKGCGAWLNGNRITVSKAGSLVDSLMATGFPYSIRQCSRNVIDALESMVLKCQGVRRAGAATLDLAYVACGRLDGFWEIGLKPWDTAAGVVILEEAGGRLSDFRGRPFSPFVPEVLATNGTIHQQASKILEQFSELTDS